MTNLRKSSVPALGEEDGDGEGGGECGAGEVDSVVAEAAGAFEGGSEEAVEDGSEECGGEDGPEIAGGEKTGPLAGRAGNEDGAEREDGSGRGDAAILAGSDRAKRGDEAGTSSEGLAEFAANGVSGGFGEGG